jgi:hypothetical protein
MPDGVKRLLSRARDLAARRAAEILSEKALTRAANKRAAELTAELRDAKVASAAAAVDFGIVARRWAPEIKYWWDAVAVCAVLRSRLQYAEA